MQFGATPLIFASMSGQIEVATLLVGKGADLYAQNSVSTHISIHQFIHLITKGAIKCTHFIASDSSLYFISKG